MKFRHHLLATSALLAASIGVTAHAQTSGAAKAASTNTIEELVVTAQKREQSLQDVPVAVSAFTSEKRDLVGITTIADMTNFTPGLEYNAQNDRNTLRGVGRNTNVHAAQGSVAQYSDGVYTSSTVQAGESPLFIDRVEVLRGPQGTLYGRNSIAGAINIISKRPTDDPYAEVRGRYENYDHFLLEGAVSGPTAINGVDFRLAANWEKQSQGWFTNTVPGQPDQGNIIDTKLVEGQLKMKFNERFDGWMKLDWADWHNKAGGPGSGDTWSPVPFGLGEFGTTAIGPNNPGYACLPGNGVTGIQTPPGMTLAQACTNAATTDPRKFTSDTPYQVKLTGTMIFASEWNYHFDFADLKYIFGGTHYNYALTGPNPVGTAPIIAFQLPRVLPPGTVPGVPVTLVIPGGGPLVHPRGAFNYHEALNWVSPSWTSPRTARVRCSGSAASTTTTNSTCSPSTRRWKTRARRRCRRSWPTPARSRAPARPCRRTTVGMTTVRRRRPPPRRRSARSTGSSCRTGSSPWACATRKTPCTAKSPCACSATTARSARAASVLNWSAATSPSTGPRSHPS
jgi:outer membrane receptor protein involved in Fe transport